MSSNLGVFVSVVVELRLNLGPLDLIVDVRLSE